MFHSSCDTRDQLDSIEALAEIFSLRGIGTPFLERIGVGVLELPSIAWDFETSAKSWAMKIHGAAAMAILYADRHAPERSCEIRMACAPQSSKRLDSSECVRRFNHHRLRPLLCRWRKPACVDELDSSRCRPGVADFAVDPHLSGKEDTPYGSILNEVTLLRLRASRDRHAKSHYSESQRGG